MFSPDVDGSADVCWVLIDFFHFQSFALSCHVPFPALALPPFAPEFSAWLPRHLHWSGDPSQEI